MSEKVVVVGAGFLGLNTALKLKRRGYEVELVDKNSFHQYIPGLIDLFRDRVNENKIKLDLENFLDSTEISFHKEEVRDVNPEKKIVETDKTTYSYDYLVLAVGADPATHGTDISDAEHCYNLESSKELDSRLEDAESATVIGSGYVGVEVAGELIEKGLNVTVVDLSTSPMSNSSDKASKKVLDYFNNKDIKFKGGRKVKKIEKSTINFEDDSFQSSDLLIWCGGIQSSKQLQNWLNTSKRGLEVNKGLCSNEYKDIFAGGDCANQGEIKTAHNAIKQSEIIAENIERSEIQDLQKYEETDLTVVSLGKTGMLVYGKIVLKNRFFRYLKDLIRKKYWIDLRKEKFKLKVFG